LSSLGLTTRTHPKPRMTAIGMGSFTYLQPLASILINQLAPLLYRCLRSQMLGEPSPQNLTIYQKSIDLYTEEDFHVMNRNTIKIVPQLEPHLSIYSGRFGGFLLHQELLSEVPPHNEL